VARGGRPPRAVVLGAQFGGLSALHWLRRLAGPAEVEVTVVSPKPYAVYKPDLVLSAAGDARFVPATRVDLVGICRRLNARLVVDWAAAIDAARARVHVLNHPPLAYDALFWATGMDYAWSSVPGLGPETGFMCEDYAARHLAARLGRLGGGDIVLVAGRLHQDPRVRPALSASCDCPLIEWGLLARAALRRRGRAAQPRIALVTAADAPGESLGPAAARRARALLAQAEIRVVARAEVLGVERGGLEVQTPAGRLRLPSDVSVWMPPVAGSDLARRSALDDGYGWVETDAHLRHVRWPDIYALGDLNRATLPKLGHSAMVEARVAVGHWLARLRGRRSPPPYRRSVLAVMQTGGGRALFDWHDTLYGGRRELWFEGRTAYALKQGFGLAYRLGRGGLPIMP
jgi:sulfide:quinone oxidoreductase